MATGGESRAGIQRAAERFISSSRMTGRKCGSFEWKLTEFDNLSESTTTTTNHAYPTSSRKQTNWDAVAKAAAAEDDLPADPKDPNSGGDAALNKLFQSIYSGGTDEQKKAMIKSYQESGGTALSTDWNEVQKVRQFAFFAKSLDC